MNITKPPQPEMDNNLLQLSNLTRIALGIQLLQISQNTALRRCHPKIIIQSPTALAASSIQ
jgi:hypothetical protein